MTCCLPGRRRRPDRSPSAARPRLRPRPRRAPSASSRRGTRPQVRGSLRRSAPRSGARPPRDAASRRRRRTRRAPLAHPDLQRQRSLAAFGRSWTIERSPISASSPSRRGRRLRERRRRARARRACGAGCRCAPQRLDRERRLQREQLRPSPDRGGADASPAGALRRRRARRADPRAAGYAPTESPACPSRSCPWPSGRRRRSARRAAPPRAPRRRPARADLAEGPRPVAVARRRDRHECDLDPGPPQPLRGLLRLGEREPTAAGTDANEHSFRATRASLAERGRRGCSAGSARTPSAPAGAMAARW